MCGIAGFIDLWDTKDVRDREERARILDNMCEVIRYRGPDDSGSMLKDGVALGMRRLSIIDLGRRPTTDFRRRWFGDHRLQRRDLQLPRIAATTRSTAVTSFALAQIPKRSSTLMKSTATACVDHLRGMFAFAIWDDRQKKLFLARDRAGEKPLYYTVTPTGTLVFGSELKSLLEHPGVKRETSSESLDAYLSLGYVPDPLSIFKDIKKLSPGHFLTFSNGRAGDQTVLGFHLRNERAPAQGRGLPGRAA